MSEILIHSLSEEISATVRIEEDSNTRTQIATLSLKFKKYLSLFDTLRLFVNKSSRN